MSEIVFEVREDEIDGGYCARALGHPMFTQGEDLEDLRAMVKDAVNCAKRTAENYSAALHS